MVCRELGYPEAVSAPTSAHFGQGSGTIWMDDVQCVGTESSIVNCQHSGWNVHNCGHSEDASVICLSKHDLKYICIVTYCVTFSKFPGSTVLETAYATALQGHRFLMTGRCPKPEYSKEGYTRLFPVILAINTRIQNSLDLSS